jgi:signal peptidase II
LLGARPYCKSGAVSQEHPADKADGQDRAEEAGDGGDPAPRSEPREAEPQAPPKRRGPSYVFLGVASAIFLMADLGSKGWAAKRLETPGKGVVVVDGIEVWGTRYSLHFDLAKNKGGAWGVLGEQPDYVRLPFFFLISALAVVFIVSLYKKLEPRQWALKWALPLVLGGALGNLVDRIRHQHVIDFIDAFMEVDGKVSHWPTFNVADIWIVAGVILMVIDMFMPRQRVRPARAGEEAARAR